MRGSSFLKRSPWSTPTDWTSNAQGGAAHSHLAAVGVAFLLGRGGHSHVTRTGLFRGIESNRRSSDCSTSSHLGTVADVAQLKGLNRAFVAQGLKGHGRARQHRPVGALIEASRLTRAPLCSDLGFALGPRINAGGRVGKSDLGVRLLTTRDPEEARAIAADLDALNNERRAIESMVQESRGGANRRRNITAPSSPWRPKGWHPGVIGIVAGRIKEKTGKPSLVIALDADGVGKGSGRSVGGVDLGAAIIAAKDAGIACRGRRDMRWRQV